MFGRIADRILGSCVASHMVGVAILQDLGPSWLLHLLACADEWVWNGVLIRYYNSNEG